MSTTVCSNLSIEDILMAIEDFRKSLQDYAGMIEALDADMLASIRTNLDVLLREYQEVPVLSSDPCSMLLPVFLCLSSERQGYKDLAREFEVRNGQNSRTSSKPPRTDIHLLQLLRYKVIRLENLDGFSEELQEKLTWIIGNE